MKKILVATWLVIVPYAAHAANGILNVNSDGWAITYYFGPDQGESLYDNNRCGFDACEADDGFCYSVPNDASEYMSCYEYCENNGLGEIFWDNNDLVCGCDFNSYYEWRAAGTGRERKYAITPTDCSGGQTSAATNEYRCAAGYYGNGTTCTRCPGVENTAGTTVYGNSPTGATSRTQCTLPAGTYKDATGTCQIAMPCAHD